MMTGLSRTLRIVGVAIAAEGRAVDLALIETDAGDLIRRLDCERQPLSGSTLLAATIEAVRVFIGDRALQPFAIDMIALAEERPGLCALDLGIGLDIDCMAGQSGRGTGTRAERAAFAAAAHVASHERASMHTSCLAS